MKRQHVIIGLVCAGLICVWAWWVSREVAQPESVVVSTAPTATGEPALPSTKAPVVEREMPAEVKLMGGPPPVGRAGDRSQALAFQGALHGVVKEAHLRCLQPYVDTMPDDYDCDLVMDAVSTDGTISDITVRALDPDMPKHVIDCIVEVAWETDWPARNSIGERRYQRMFTAR